MQVKVVIGTIAFMLVMIIFAVATLLEPARLEATTAAFRGRQIENGAQLFKENCAECHGVEGKAQNCVTYSGEEKGCVGLPLNHVALLCGEPSQRMTQLGWTGSKQNLIDQTVSAGRPGTLMPTWSQDFGGPMESYQIEQLSTYIMNWGEDPDLCGDGAIVAEAVDWPESAGELPTGDAANGPALYQSLGCVGCHGDPGVSGSNAVGPWLGNIGNDAADRVAGMPAEQYIYESILDPGAFIAQDCPTGPCTEPSAMAALNLGSRMTEQQMADLIAYYLTLTGGN